MSELIIRSILTENQTNVKITLGILVSGAFIMINWTIVTRTVTAITAKFLCASMLSSAYLIVFSLAILNFLFADFISDDIDDYAKIQTV